LVETGAGHWPTGLYAINLTKKKQESRAVAKKPRDAAAVVFGLKFVDNIHYKFAFESRASELQSYRRKTEFNAKWPFYVAFWSQ